MQYQQHETFKVPYAWGDQNLWNVYNFLLSLIGEILKIHTRFKHYYRDRQELLRLRNSTNEQEVVKVSLVVVSLFIRCIKLIALNDVSSILGQNIAKSKNFLTPNLRSILAQFMIWSDYD